MYKNLIVRYRSIVIVGLFIVVALFGWEKTHWQFQDIQPSQPGPTSAVNTEPTVSISPGTLGSDKKCVFSITVAFPSFVRAQQSASLDVNIGWFTRSPATAPVPVATNTFTYTSIGEFTELVWKPITVSIEGWLVVAAEVTDTNWSVNPVLNTAYSKGWLVCAADAPKTCVAPVTTNTDGTITCPDGSQIPADDCCPWESAITPWAGATAKDCSKKPWTTPVVVNGVSTCVCDPSLPDPKRPGKFQCCGIKLLTSVPFIGKCIYMLSDAELKALGAKAAANPDVLAVSENTAFPRLMLWLTKILVTVILLASFIAIIVAGVMMAASGSGEEWYTNGKKIIGSVIAAIALLGASGVILRLINPNFFG